MSKKSLFLVGTPYQLFNAIILRLTECKDDKCDIILRPDTEWDDEMVGRLNASGLFRKILSLNCVDNIMNFWLIDLETRKKMVDNPLLFFGEEPVKPIYEKLFVPVPHIAWKLLYYFLVVNGSSPEVYMYDEGLMAYTLDVIKTDNPPCFRGEYAKKPFGKAIEAYYLFQPELYAIKDHHYALRKIPNPNTIPEVREKLIEIYGQPDMPSEQYIYIEDYYFGDHHLTNDFDLFLKVADMVGKENIIVKRHPRCKEDRFTPLGFKTTSDSKVPWEIQLMTNNLNKKRLISVTSTAILTPFIIFESDMHVISLKDMLIGKAAVLIEPGFDSFFNSAVKKVNDQNIYFHKPASVDDLLEIVRYFRVIDMEDCVGKDNVQ